VRFGNESGLLEIGPQDRHLEIVRPFVVFVVHEDDTDELFADIDLGGIVLLRPRHHPHARIVEQPLEIGVDLPDFLHVHADYSFFVGRRCHAGGYAGNGKRLA
jgi:hypothetical protein